MEYSNIKRKMLARIQSFKCKLRTKTNRTSECGVKHFLFLVQKASYYEHLLKKEFLSIVHLQ